MPAKRFIYNPKGRLNCTQINGHCQEEAPAKLNLTLHVGPLRKDGYHEVQSLVVFLSCADRVTLSHRVLPPGDKNKLLLTASGPFCSQLPVDQQENIVTKAVRLFFKEIGESVPSMAIHIEKNIPVGAGLAGGSANAAAILRLLVRQFGVQYLPLASDIAAQLGSDVRACLFARSCQITGRGEILHFQPVYCPPFVVLVYPNVVLSTKSVYEAFQKQGKHLPLNDLESVARQMCPQIEKAITCLKKVPGCLGARLSGSGSVCFGLFERERQAQSACAHLNAASRSWTTILARPASFPGIDCLFENHTQ